MVPVLPPAPVTRTVPRFKSAIDETANGLFRSLLEILELRENGDRVSRSLGVMRDFDREGLGHRRRVEFDGVRGTSGTSVAVAIDGGLVGWNIVHPVSPRKFEREREREVFVS